MRFFGVSLLMLALSLPLSGYAENDELKSYNDDATSGKVKAALAKDQLLSALDIKVQSDDVGAVHLSGRVRSQAEVSQAALVARSVSGVVSVQNDIVIEEPTADKARK